MNKRHVIAAMLAGEVAKVALVVLCVGMPFLAHADAPVITEECTKDVSLFYEAAKNKLYADAVEPWLRVYEQCPNANKAIYSQGPNIIEWQISQAKTEEEKQVLKNRLMEVYDKRIEYFGNDPKYPVAYILGEKGLGYCKFFTEDALQLPAYGWLKESVTGMGTRSKLSVIWQFAQLTNRLYKADPEKNAEQYIADYQQISDLLNALSAPNVKNAAAAKTYKENIDNAFALSGAADCGKLDELYAQTVQTNLGDLETLNKVMTLYKKVKCIESDVYFAAAEAAHKLQPTAESAAGCAAMSAKKNNIADAIAYYDQAFELSDNDEDKANYLYNNAAYCYQQKQYVTARQYARRSLEINPDQGRCYMLIGLMYAASKPYDDEVLNKTVFWVACDKFNKAKQVDPAVADEANRMISQYSKYFPTTEEMFFNAGAGLVKGQPFTVGGWIGETTICR